MNLDRERRLDGRLPECTTAEEAAAAPKAATRPSLCSIGWFALFLCGVVLMLTGYGFYKHFLDKPAIGEVQELTAKPKADQRSYGFVVLPNGLKVVGVHDPKALTAAFSVAVQAGSYDEPRSLPGLAHFVEHMVFLGSERYPEPSGYDDFINAHGGSLNAYTASEATVYHTEVDQEAVEEGLDRFSDFLHAPLFDTTYMEKEVHAVDSEHAKNVQDPDRRIMAVLDDLADPSSPVSQFHTGDVETLMRNARATDMREELRSWFTSHYCPGRMALATYGSEPISQQLHRAARAFGHLPVGSRTCQEPRKSWASPAAWPQHRRGKFVTVLGTQPQPQLIQAFMLPDTSKDFKSQPLAYIRYLLNYGGEHSLLTLLRDDLGLVSRLDVSEGTGSPGTMLLVSYDLSRQGLDQPGAVLDAFFFYLAAVRHKPVDRKLYASIANVSRLGWDWTQPQGPAETVADLAEALTRLPPDNLLSGDALVEEPDAGLVASLIGQLVPDRMNTLLVDHEAKLKTPAQNVSHYGVLYNVDSIRSQLPENWERWAGWLKEGAPESREAFLAELRRIAPGVAAVTLPEQPKPIEVPAEIATDSMSAAVRRGKLFGESPTVLGRTGGTAQPNIAFYDAATVPEEAWHATSSKWYRQGWVSVSPEVKAMVVLRPRLVEEEWERTAADVVRLSLYTSLLSEAMAPRLFDHMTGGAGYELEFGPSGIKMSVGGFPTLVPKLLGGVLADAKTGLAAFNSSARFARLVTELKDSLQSYSEMPVSYAVADRDVLLTTSTFSREESLAALSSVHEASVVAAPQELLLSRPLEFRGLVMGNVAQAEAVGMLAQVEEGLTAVQTHADAVGEVLAVTPVVQPAAPVELRKQNPRLGDPNDVVVVSLLAGVATVESRVIYGLLGQILSQLAYNELRTRQQLGYVVSAGQGKTSNVLFMSTVVQGKAVGAEEAEVAVEQVNFELMPQRLANMTKEEFQSYRRAFKSSLMQPPASVQEEFEHFWSPIAHNGECLELRSEMLRYLEESVSDKRILVDVWDKLIHPEVGLRKKVAVKYFAGAVPERPSLQEAQLMWQKAGVSEASMKSLADEYRSAQILDRADSQARLSLLKAGGYYSQALNCELARKEKEARFVDVAGDTWETGRPSRRASHFAFLGVSE